MKQFYTLLLLAACSLLSFTANAKTLTLKATADNAVYYVDTSNGNTVPVTTAGVSVNIAVEGNIIINANTGWRILKIAQEGGGQSFEYPEGIDSTDGRVVSYPFADGSTVLVTVAEGTVSKPKILVRGTAGQFRVSYNYGEYNPDENGEITLDNENSSMSIYANDGYVLTGVTAGGENIAVQGNGAYAQFYTGNYHGETTVVEVATKASGEMMKGKFTVNTVGATYKYYIYDANYNYTYIDSESQEISFQEGSTYTFSSQYGTLCKIEVNGRTVASGWTSYRYTPADGDVVTVTTDFPETPVDVKFTFTDGADADIIKEFRYDNQLIDASVWNSPSWQPMLGKSIGIRLNVGDYNNVRVNINGEEKEYEGYNDSFSFTLTEPEYKISISAVHMSGYNVTVIVDGDPDGIMVTKGYYSQYSSNTFINLDGAETHFELSRYDAGNGIQFTAKPGYRINALEVTPSSGSQIYNNMVYVKYDDTEIVVSVEKIERNNTMMIFVESYAWNYGPLLTLSQNDNSMRTEVNLTAGYNEVKFCNDDITNGLGLSGYPQPVVYLNGKECAISYGRYEGLETVTDGDVIKVYTSAPTPRTINYSFGEGVSMSVTHDRITAVDNPSVHTVFDGTEVSLVPVSLLADDGESETRLVVKVNNSEIKPDAEGRFTFAVDGDTNVNVTKESTGVDNIMTDVDSTGVIYNLQGVRIGSETSDLPAGIYIVDGRKVFIKQ